MPMAIGHRCRPPPDLLRRSSAPKGGRRKRAPSSPSGGGARQRGGGKYERSRRSFIRVSGMEPSDFKDFPLLHPAQSSALKPPVSFTHLVARKGRVASDHRGGGGRSSGDRFEGVTRTVRG